MLVDMSDYNGVHLSFPSPTTWNGLPPSPSPSPSSSTSPCEEGPRLASHEVVQFWQEAIIGWAKVQGENDLLRKRIAILEAQVAQWGM